MKYTNLEGQKFNFDGLMYRTLFDKNPRGPVGGYSDRPVLNHINIDGDDYVEFTSNFYVKVDDMYNRNPYDERISFANNSNEISYEIY